MRVHAVRADGLMWLDRPLRTATRGNLPDALLNRGKATIPVNLMEAGLRGVGLPQLDPDHSLATYVNLAKLKRNSSDAETIYKKGFRALALNFWLRNLNLC